MASKQPQTEPDTMASVISRLVIDSTKATPSKAKKNQPVADSWEDEDVSDGEEADREEEQDDDAELASSSTPSSLTSPAVPPPTPASPLALDSPLANQSQSRSQSQSQGQSPPATSASGSGSGTPARRPEKTDAVARRMIAAGLGLKAPKQTEEQRAYQRSVREQEKKRRDAQRAEEERQREAAERAKAAVWDD
ncbi:hypothetical protein J3F83DRAFT_721572 [Trichoderma novae-zelandiae]